MNSLKLSGNSNKALLTAEHVDHFFGLDGNVWNTIQSDSNATVAIDADGVGGVVQLAVTTADNQECYLYTNEIFKIADGKPIMVVARLQYTDAATNAANVVFGLADGVAGDLIPDSGGIKTTFTGAVIGTTEGETRWKLHANNGGTTDVTELDYTAGGTSYQTLALHIDPISATRFTVTPMIDTSGSNALLQGRQYDVNPRVPLVKTELSYSSPTEMALVIGLKNSGAHTQTLNVDLAAFALNL